MIPEGKGTSLHFARRADVSRSAVSRVFSGASASEQTVLKVRKAAEHLGYRPNPLARAMITGKSKIIGLVVAYLGAVVIPPEVVGQLGAAIAKMQETEKLVLEPVRAAGFDFAAFEKAWAAVEKSRT